MTTRPFEEIVTEHGPVVLRVCRALLGPVDAEDAWSETFLAAIRAYPELRPDSNVRGWLVTIAHNRAIDHLRRKARRPTPVEALPERSFHDAPSPDAGLRDALNDLAPKQRGAVVLRYLADLSYAEVGRALDCSEAAARRSAADGITRLRTTYLQPDPEGTER